MQNKILYFLTTIACFGIATDCCVAALLFGGAMFHSPILLAMMASAAFILNFILYYKKALKEANDALNKLTTNPFKTIAALLAGIAMGLYSYGVYLNMSLHFSTWIIVLFSFCYMIGTTTLMLSALNSKDFKFDNIKKHLPIAGIMFIVLAQYNNPSFINPYIFIALVAILLEISIRIQRDTPTLIAFSLSCLSVYGFTNYSTIVNLINLKFIDKSGIYFISACILLSAIYMAYKENFKEYLSLIFIFATISLSCTWFDQGVFAIESIFNADPIIANILMFIFVAALTICEIAFVLDVSNEANQKANQFKDQSLLGTIVAGILMTLNTMANMALGGNTFTKSFPNLLANLSNGTLSPTTYFEALIGYKTCNEEETTNGKTKAFTALSILAITTSALYSMQFISIYALTAIMAGAIFLALIGYLAKDKINVPNNIKDSLSSASNLKNSAVIDSLPKTLAELKDLTPSF